MNLNESKGGFMGWGGREEREGRHNHITISKNEMNPPSLHIKIVFTHDNTSSLLNLMYGSRTQEPET